MAASIRPTINAKLHLSGAYLVGILDLFRGSKAELIARRYIKALREAGELRQMVHVPAERVVAVLDEHGKRSQVAFLGNLEREINRASEAEHEAIYRRYAASQMDTAVENRSKDYAAIRPTLRILLKDETYPAYIALQTLVDLPDGKPSSNVYEPIVGDVIACCVQEQNNGLRFVTETDLIDWGVSAEQVLRDARDNVCVLACEVHSSSSGHAYFVFANDSFQAARLVHAALFKDRPARGMWVAVVPDRDTYFLAESEDLEGLAGLARLAERQFEEGDRLISGTPFVMRDGTWQVFDPPEAVRVAFANVARRFAASRWKDYKAVLERDLQRREDDAFVASLNVYQNDETKAYWSDVIWSKGVDTILPPADRVVFFEGDGLPLRLAAWPDVMRVMGSSMQKLDGLPDRFRVNTFPRTEQMAAMGASLG